MKNKLIFYTLIFMQCSISHTIYSSENDEILYPHYDEIMRWESHGCKPLPFKMQIKDGGSYYIKLETETDSLKDSLWYEGNLSARVENSNIFLQLNLHTSKEKNEWLVSKGDPEDKPCVGIFKIFPPEKVYSGRNILETFVNDYSTLRLTSDQNIYMTLIEALDVGDGEYVKAMPQEKSFIVNEEQVNKIVDIIKTIKAPNEPNHHWLKIYGGLSIGVIIIAIACYFKFRSQ